MPLLRGLAELALAAARVESDQGKAILFGVDLLLDALQEVVKMWLAEVAFKYGLLSLQRVVEQDLEGPAQAPGVFDVVAGEVLVWLAHAPKCGWLWGKCRVGKLATAMDGRSAGNAGAISGRVSGMLLVPTLLRGNAYLVVSSNCAPTLEHRSERTPSPLPSPASGRGGLLLVPEWSTKAQAGGCKDISDLIETRQG